MCLAPESTPSLTKHRAPHITAVSPYPSKLALEGLSLVGHLCSRLPPPSPAEVLLLELFPTDPACPPATWPGTHFRARGWQLLGSWKHSALQVALAGFLSLGVGFHQLSSHSPKVLRLFPRTLRFFKSLTSQHGNVFLSWSPMSPTLQFEIPS